MCVSVCIIQCSAKYHHTPSLHNSVHTMSTAFHRIVRGEIEHRFVEWQRVRIICKCERIIQTGWRELLFKTGVKWCGKFWHWVRPLRLNGLFFLFDTKVVLNYRSNREEGPNYFFFTLSNPRIRGGGLHLPHDWFSTMVSRPSNQPCGQPWSPAWLGNAIDELNSFQIFKPVATLRFTWGHKNEPFEALRGRQWRGSRWLFGGRISHRGNSIELLIRLTFMNDPRTN